MLFYKQGERGTGEAPWAGGTLEDQEWLRRRGSLYFSSRTSELQDLSFLITVVSKPYYTQ